jgi:hypothetical protein
VIFIHETLWYNCLGSKYRSESKTWTQFVHAPYEKLFFTLVCWKPPYSRNTVFRSLLYDKKNRRRISKDVNWNKLARNVSYGAISQQNCWNMSSTLLDIQLFTHHTFCGTRVCVCVHAHTRTYRDKIVSIFLSTTWSCTGWRQRSIHSYLSTRQEWSVSCSGCTIHCVWGCANMIS